MVRKTIELDDDGDLKVYNVILKGTNPPEIHATYLEKDDAHRDAASMGPLWEVRVGWVFGSRNGI